MCGGGMECEPWETYRQMQQDTMLLDIMTPYDTFFCEKVVQ